MTAAGKPNLVAPLPPSVSFPHGILTKCRHAPGVFMLEFNKGENRIGVDFLQQTVRRSNLNSIIAQSWSGRLT